jgi:antitoxin HigA-1
MTYLNYGSAMRKYLKPIHPGFILRHEFMRPCGLSPRALADEIGVSPHEVDEILIGRILINPDISKRLDELFSMSEGFFARLQDNFMQGMNLYAQRMESQISAITVRKYPQRHRLRRHWVISLLPVTR